MSDKPNDTTKKYFVQPIDKFSISPHQEVYVSRQGRFAEVVWMEHTPKNHIRRLPDSLIIDPKSGEARTVMNFMRLKERLAKGETRHFQREYGETKGLSNIKRAMRRLKGIIRTNFGINREQELHLTLTYAENMQDSKRLFKDMDEFMKRLKYHYSQHNLEYVAVAEPQERGAWHMHILIKTDKPVLYIDHHDLTDIWGHGRADSIRMNMADIGDYFATYFSDLRSKKGRKKGARLHFYPPRMKFYRCSRGIIRPPQNKENYGTIETEYGEPQRTSAFEIWEETPKSPRDDPNYEPLDSDWKQIQTLQTQSHQNGQ